MTWASTAIDLFGVALDVYGTVKATDAAEESGKQAKAIDYANAQAAEEEAEAIKKQRERSLEILSKEKDKIVGAQRSTYSKAGVLLGTGTTKVVEERTLQDAELDAIAIREGADTEARRLYSEADVYRTRGDWASESAAAKSEAIKIKFAARSMDDLYEFFK
jgi:hypothetical protein